MSVIQRKPFIQLVMESLTQSLKTTLLGLVNGSDKTPDFRSLVNESALITGSDKNKVQYVTLETWAKLYTGYLVYNNSYCVLIAFSSNTQALVMLDINATNRSYKVVKEYLDINELRRYIEEADEHITTGEIDSGTAIAGQVLAADGDGGAEWVSGASTIKEDDTETGNAVQMAAFDEDGNLIHTNLPEGTVVVDASLSTESENPVQNKVITEEVNKKANKDGNYPTLTAGLADNLNTKIVQNEVEAYLFRTTGGSLEVGNNCKEKGIVGGSLGFNQLVVDGDFATLGNWYTAAEATRSVSNNTFTVTVNTDFGEGQIRAFCGQGALNINKLHKHFVSFEITANTASNLCRIRQPFLTDWFNVGTTKQVVSYVGVGSDSNQNNEFVVQSVATPAGTVFTVKNVVCIDLTAMFGETIANYIYSLETGTAGAGAAWFRKYFNKPYYPYTAVGGFTSVKTSGKKVVGFNQWDEEYELGKYITSDGSVMTHTGALVGKNFIRVVPNTTYYFKCPSSNVGGNIILYDGNENFIGRIQYKENQTFTTPADCYYIKVSFYEYGTTYNNDVCINFHYDGERDGEYEPYESTTYDNDNIELIGVPHIDASGNLYYTGNVYRPDGTVEKSFKYVDLSTALISSGNYRPASGNGQYGNDNLLSEQDQAPDVGSNGVANAMSPQLTVISPNECYQATKVGFSVNKRSIWIHIDGFSSNEDYRTWLTNNHLYVVYELATPTEVETTSYPEVQACNNWGTEQRIDNRDVPIPVGHDTDYPLDLKSKLEIMPDLPSSDGTYVCKVTSGTAEYVALGSWLTVNGFIKLTDITGYDATETQVLKNVEGTLTWVTEE